MKFVCIADIHRRASTPKHRIDDYGAAQDAKLISIIRYANNINAPILCGGDMFDTAFSSHDTVRAFIKILKHNLSVPFISCYGQHDLRNHSLKSMQNTPLSVVSQSDLIHTIPHYVFEDATVYVVNWNEEVPEPDPDTFNILLWHKMIVRDKELWPGQDAPQYAKMILKKYSGYKLIVTGDNHESFTFGYKGRHLINPGSLMRSTSAQLEHEPKFYVFDTEKPGAIEVIILGVEPADLVFDLESIQEEQVKKKTEDMKAFVSALNITGNDVSFTKILQEVVTKANPREGVITFVEEVLNEVGI